MKVPIRWPRRRPTSYRPFLWGIVEASELVSEYVEPAQVLLLLPVTIFLVSLLRVGSRRCDGEYKSEVGG